MKRIAFVWAGSLLCCILVSNVFAQPQKPSISGITPAQPEGLDDIVVTASAPSGSIAKSVWQISIDPAFPDDPANNQFLYREYTFPVGYPLDSNNTRTDESLTVLTIPNTVIPFNVPLYVRVQYIDANENASEFSDGAEFTLQPFSNLNVIIQEDFENVPVNGLPENWKAVNFADVLTDFGAGYSANFIDWSVQELDFLNTIKYYPGYLRTGDANRDFPELYFSGVPIVEGKSLHAGSAGYGSAYYEAHVITEEFDLSGAENVFVTFNSDYLQNQDNIATVEYTTDGGDLLEGEQNELRNFTGTWNPALYYLQVNHIVFVVEGDPSSGIEVDFTLGQDIPDTNFDIFFEDLVFAKDSVDFSEIAPFIKPTIEEDMDRVAYKDNKRYERLRLEKADNQSSVKLKFMYQGTFSWHWGIDNMQIWAAGGAVPVYDWSIY